MATKVVNMPSEPVTVPGQEDKGTSGEGVVTSSGTADGLRAPAGSPWTTAKTPSPTRTSLADVMSEQLAAKLGTSPEKRPLQTSISPVSAGTDDVVPLEFLTEQEESDRAIAQLLQYEMDLEHDEVLQRVEKHRNGEGKISISLANFRHLHPVESRDELHPLPDFPEPCFSPEKPPEFNARGISGKGKNIVTKHDADVCGRRNVQRIMSNFPPNFATGDDFEYDSKIPNKVFNELRVHSDSLQKRSKKLKDKKEDDATATFSVDQKTRLLLYKMLNNGLIQSINGVICTGKESVVFHAVGGDISDPNINNNINKNEKNKIEKNKKTEKNEKNEKKINNNSNNNFNNSNNFDIDVNDNVNNSYDSVIKLPEECALKVFKTTLNEFRNRDPYIRDDYRFQERYSKLNPRKIVKLWAEKEMLNLKRMTEHGVPCPEPFLLRKHILVLTFLGKNQKAAPKLKDAVLSSVQWQRAYDETVQIMKTMYTDCKLIHADFSEYNLLWHEGKVWVIDVSQSVEPGHPRAMEFLYRDCRNVENFFTRMGVKNVLNAKDLLQTVSGVKIQGTGEELLPELQSHGGKKVKPHKFEADEEGASFDHLYEKASQERLQEAEDQEDDWELVDDDESTSSSDEELV